MTLIALARSSLQGQDSLICISDTRVSGEFGELTGHFTKQFRVSYHISSGTNGGAPERSWRGQMGFAFAGGTLAGTAVANLVNIVLGNLHSKDAIEPVSVENIAQAAARCATVITQRRGLSFEALLFGYYPTEVEPFIIKLSRAPNAERVNVGFLPTEHNIPHLLGSGKAAFERIVTENGDATASLEAVCRRAIHSGYDPGTGGGMQIGVASQLIYDHRLTIEHRDDEATADVRIGALNVTEFGPVGDFHIGRVAWLVS